MNIRWIASNYGNLFQHNFGVADMPSIVEIMDKAFYKVLIDGEKLIDKDFMMVYLWNNEEAAATTRVPQLHFQEQIRQISGVPQRRGQGFAMRFIDI